MDTLINFHVIDPNNLGDYLSSPFEYFDFPGLKTERWDLQELRDFAAAPDSPGKIRDYLAQLPENVRVHSVFGGGGLLASQFQTAARTAFEKVSQPTGGGAIAWGVGQQSYNIKNLVGTPAEYRNNVKQQALDFPYDDYVKGWDLVGVRDDLENQYWVPCASCMHPAFDKDYVTKHDFVVYSHKKFQLKIPGIPTLDHTEKSMDKVLEFLGSGKTILTSSFHGAYWGTLLGRKVLAFPFTSKFMTLKHPVGLYPHASWAIPQIRWQPFKTTFLNKINIKIKLSKSYKCPTKGWENYLEEAQAHPNALAECRERNQLFHQQVMDLVSSQ
ncbi:MAG: hypothetical protein ACFCA4_03150 [Cyanophyceae cyanobacterium]